MWKSLVVKFLSLLIVTVVISCNDDDSSVVECKEPLGQLETVINDQTVFQARWTVFEYFDNGALSVASIVMDQNCLLRADLVITGEPNLNRQDFVITSAQFIRDPTNISFSQIDEDAVLGRWEIV